MNEEPLIRLAKLTVEAEELLRDQAVTLGKRGDVITLGCESLDDAEVIWEWLNAIIG